MRKTVFLVVSLTGFVLAGLLAYQINLKEHFKSLVPHLTVGESVPAVSFMNHEDQPVALSDFEVLPILLLVFERPCTTCTSNIPFWMKLSELAGERAHVLGIILDRGEMISIAETKRLPFKLISPVDGDEFVRAWRLRLNLAQTMIVKGDRVRYIRLGNLMAKDMRGIINTLREGEEK